MTLYRICHWFAKGVHCLTIRKGIEGNYSMELFSLFPFLAKIFQCTKPDLLQNDAQYWVGFLLLHKIRIVANAVEHTKLTGYCYFYKSLLMSFTCKDRYKFINQRYYNQVLWAISSGYQQKITIMLNGITFKFVNYQLWFSKKNYHNVNGILNHKFLYCDKNNGHHNMNGNYNLSNNLSPMMEASHISMLLYCSKPFSSQVRPRKRSHVPFHRNDLLHYFNMCPK